MKEKKILILLTALIASFGVFGADENSKFSDPRLKLVSDYLTSDQDYPEVFKDKHYRIKVDDVAYGDLDGDGLDEVVLVTRPHYRQSPTITIFRLDKEKKVTRVKEGFAPGKLQPVSGDYLDSHNGGFAVDISFDEKDLTPEKREIALNSLFEKMNGVVEYANFTHADTRQGKGVYIDMRHVEPPQKNNCENFEFAKVEAIMLGKKNGVHGAFILAQAGGEVYSYHIHRFLENGLIDKTIQVMAAKPKK